MGTCVLYVMGMSLKCVEEWDGDRRDVCELKEIRKDLLYGGLG